MDNLELLRYSHTEPYILKTLFKEIVHNYYIKDDKARLTIEGIKEGLIDFYPNIEKWFNKVIKEIDEDNKKRELFLAIVANKTNIELACILVLKNTEIEKKICTLQVVEKFRNQGIGKKMLEKSFEYLGTRTPFMTLPEECYEKGFNFLLEKYKFKMTNRIKGLYRPNKIEYFFNEVK